MPPSATGIAAAFRSFQTSMFDRVDSLVLVYLRALVGISIYFWSSEFLTDDRYQAIFVEPRFLFKYSGFEWVRLWPGDGIYWHLVALKITSVCLLIGFLTRLSAIMLCASIGYLLLVQRQLYADYDFLLFSLSCLLIFLPAGRRLSVDSRFAIEPHRRKIWRWQLWLLRFQLGIPYSAAALAMLTGDWLRGQPVDLLLSSRSDLPLFESLSQVPAAAVILSYTGLLFALLAVPMLLNRWTRWVGVMLTLCFYIVGLLVSAGTLPWFLLASVPLFFPAQTLPYRMQLFLGHQTSGGVPQSDPAPSDDRKEHRSRAAVVIAALYIVFQTVLPLRGWMDSGNVDWNERGRHFAWRSMLSQKRALTDFLLIDENKGEHIFVPSTIILTPTQAGAADHHPELIRQTAVKLKELVAREFGVADCRVYALALVSLNGRRPTPIIDPTLDLPSLQRRGWQAKWVIDDPGPLLDPPWTADRKRWWKQLVLPGQFKALQGRTPAELQQFLEDRKRLMEESLTLEP
jgi:vitamin K-dependent gamma-carboxylase